VGHTGEKWRNALPVIAKEKAVLSLLTRQSALVLKVGVLYGWLHL